MCERVQQGFSLIELLVVVLIILVIAVDSKFLEGKNIGKRIQRRFLRSANQHAGRHVFLELGFGFAPTLANLGGPAPCLVGTAAAACLLDPLLSTVPVRLQGKRSRQGSPRT